MLLFHNLKGQYFPNWNTNVSIHEKLEFVVLQRVVPCKRSYTCSSFKILTWKYQLLSKDFQNEQNIIAIPFQYDMKEQSRSSGSCPIFTFR